MASAASQHTPAAGLLVLLVAGPGEGPLELETRRRVYLTVNRYPGLELATLADQADLDVDLVRYHVRVLEKAGLVQSREDGARRRIFPLETTKAGSASPLAPEEVRVLGLLRKPPVLRVVVALVDQGELPAGELASACGISASTASHHIRALDEAGIVAVRREGRQRLVALADRELVVRLLAEHPPPRDLVQGFIETWDELGF